MPAPIRLVVFFSRGMSLAGWQRAGILERELDLFRRLQPHCERLTFLTYGADDEEREIAKTLPGLEVLANRWRLPANLYSALAPWLHRQALAGATVFRTNQLNGAWTAALAKRRSAAKLVVRGGFLWSDNVARLHPESWRVGAARRLERFAYRAADAIVVTTDAHRQAIAERYAVDAARVTVIPNFVDTAMFAPPAAPARVPGRVLFVGRLDDGKNIAALIEAMAMLEGATLDVVGDGPLAERLRAVVAQRALPVQFLGVRPHAELTGLMQRASVFVLPSLYEGHPKALLEAMACGTPVVGADAPGIRDVITHRENGVLCGTAATEIHAELAALLKDEPLRARISAGGVDYVTRTCSLDAVAAAELALIQSL